VSKFNFPGLDVFHVKIDIENEVTDLLHGASRRPCRAGHLGEIPLASVAIRDSMARGSLLPQLGRDRNETEASRANEFILKENV
jgi:hypothetical protein